MNITLITFKSGLMEWLPAKTLEEIEATLNFIADNFESIANVETVGRCQLAHTFSKGGEQ